MAKTRRRNKDKYDTEREERVLDAWRHVRKPTPPPGKFHTERVRENDEEVDLREYRDRYNNGDIDDE